MPYTFTLQAVLDIRRHKEAAEERALASLGAHRQQVEATLGRVRQQISFWTEGRARECGGASTGASQQESYARLSLLLDAEKRMQTQLVDVSQRYTAQQATYLAARCARETLTELDRNQRGEHSLARERQEQRRLDDLILGRWSR